ncbi:hypothetical protein CC1G_03842 [Coprinopsis cinerea okayama7|uniref:NYN domain-containing protein n=1 Tax=Coprinopsis cinerea (strain Okayama-7 / 130 / ATCC MYA-4618 / FGSC 9003) TaxID=240176 RepID=A8NGX8_COPC7|nr:hypothetical protein CC1G_03842 [Coprinopsis cinerea okayama7\|eukprot:XP_001833625.1 hypothetical protein CC1G_03842 [Coprinopsis cinerea okayama7\
MTERLGRREVSIFWDVSASPKSSLGGYNVASAIRNFATRFGVIKSFKFYMDAGHGFPNSLASELQCSGVTIIDTVSNGRKGASSKMMLADCFILAMDNFSNSSDIVHVVITADPDLSYSISLLRFRGYHIIVICPPTSDRNVQRLAEGNGFDDDIFDFPSRDSFSSPDRGGSSGSEGSPPSHGNDRKGKGVDRGHAGLGISNMAWGARATPKTHVQRAEEPNDAGSFVAYPRCAEDDRAEPADEKPPTRTPPPSTPPFTPPPTLSGSAWPFTAPYRQEEETDFISPDLVNKEDAPNSPSSETQFSDFSVIPPASFSTAPTSSVPYSALFDPDDDRKGSLNFGKTATTSIPPYTAPSFSPPPPLAPSLSQQTAGSQTTVRAPVPRSPAPEIPPLDDEGSPLPQGSVPLTSTQASSSRILVPDDGKSSTGATSPLGAQSTLPLQAHSGVPSRFAPLVAHLWTETLAERTPVPFGDLVKSIDAILPDLSMTCATDDQTDARLLEYLRQAEKLNLITITGKKKNRKISLGLQRLYEAKCFAYRSSRSSYSSSPPFFVPPHFQPLVDYMRSQKLNNGIEVFQRSTLFEPLTSVQPDVFKRAGITGEQRRLGRYLDEAVNAGILINVHNEHTALHPNYQL